MVPENSIRTEFVPGDIVTSFQMSSRPTLSKLEPMAEVMPANESKFADVRAQVRPLWRNFKGLRTYRRSPIAPETGETDPQEAVAGG